MGGGSSRVEYQTVYVVPPETQKLITEQKQQLEKYEKEAKELADPKLYKTNATNLLNNFISGLHNLKLTEYIKKNDGEKHIGLIGPISSGKTTLINVMFNKQLKVALGHCTEKCEVVHSENGIVVWDICGSNDDYAFYNPESLSFIKSLDLCIVTFDNDVAMISNILKVVHKLNPKGVVVVRTKVDQYDSSNVRTIEEEKQLDVQKVKDLLKDDVKVYCISSRNVDRALPNVYDWNILKEKMTRN